MLHRLRTGLANAINDNLRHVSAARFQSRVKDAAPEVFWFRNFHHHHNGQMNIQISMASKKISKARLDLSVLVDGVPAEIEFKEASQQFKNAFWYLPGENLMDLVATVRLPERPQRSRSGIADDDYVPVTLIAEGLSPDHPSATFMLGLDHEKFSPAPPNTNIERVSGKGATGYNYWNNGRTDFFRFSSIASKHGVKVEDPSTKILDWGCGCGRLTRHWQALENGAERVSGVDIDPVNISWCKEHLAQHTFEVCPLNPPINFGGDIDLIVGNSVITHLKKDVMEEWLSALNNQLSPEGLALLSFHGDFSLAAICSRNQDFWEKIQANGFDASTSAGELNDAISDPEYYRQTFMTDAFARKMFRQYFKVEAVYVGVVSRYQNIAVLRKKA